MSIYLSLLVALIGGAVYLLVQRAQLAELGRIAFFAGLLAFLITYGHVITVPPRP